MIKQLLDEVEQKIMICLWRADQLFAEENDKTKTIGLDWRNNIFARTSLFLYTRRLCYARLPSPSHKRTKIIDEDVEIIDIL